MTVNWSSGGDCRRRCLSSGARPTTYKEGKKGKERGRAIGEMKERSLAANGRLQRRVPFRVRRWGGGNEDFKIARSKFFGLGIFYLEKSTGICSQE